MQEIADWLEKLGMSEYAQRFAEHRIDFSALSDLTDADLKDLGVVLGDRRKILRAIATLDATSETAVLIRKPPSTPSVAEVQGLPIAEGNTEQRDVTLYGITQAAEGENPRTNYNRLIGWAVKGLDGSTAEGRQVVYERARAALTAHLRLNQVGLLEADIVKERLALEEAIRGVEAEAAQKSRTEMPTASRPDTPPASASNVDGSCEPFRDGNGNPASADVPEVRLAAVVPDEPQGRQSWREGARGFRDVVSEVPGFAAIIGTAAQTGLHARAARDPETYRPESSLAQGGLARLLVVATMVIAVVATVFWQWSAIREFYQFLHLTGPEPQGDVTHNTPTAQSKTAVGVAQQQSNADAHRPTLPNGQTLPAGQQALLYEEDPTDPQGKRYTGSAIWRTETISTMAGLAPEVGIRADVSIPERRMAVTWSLRRSTDTGVPPSYTIETKFNLPADLHGAGIANVPGILMKHSEQARGTELVGLAVKVMNGYFIIEVSADDSKAQGNEQLLKDGSWFDIPIVYTNGMRAILAMEKGSQGDRTFAEVFAAWEKK